MSVKCRDVMWMMEDFAPKKLAESWENRGLNVGNQNAEVSRILVALDATEKVIDEAIEKKADMIVTHHPLIFHGIKRINYNNPDGRKIIKLIKNDINMFAAHTNLDTANGGTNDVLAKILGLKDIKVLAPHTPEGLGIGRIGMLESDTTFGLFAVKVKEELGLDAVRTIGNLSKKVKKVALCTGAGFEFLNDALKAKCDVFVTADVKYHEAMRAIDANIAVIDATHYATENIVVPIVAEYIRERLENREIDDVEVIESEINGQTFVHI